MKQLSVLLIFTLLLAIFLPLLKNTKAAAFSETFVRLDRMRANTALSGLVCATPSTGGAGTESKVSITFPSDFTLNTSLGNWTTDTSDIPSNATAWPGIGITASQITGQTVTFAGADLPSNTRYCFSFSAAGSTTGTAGTKSGNVATRETDNTLIDQTTIYFDVAENDQVTITATVPAKPTDFEAVLTQITPGSQFTENQAIEYELTYSTSLAASTDVMLEATWTQGTIQGAGSPSVDILEYESGTATDGYGGAPPVIDPVNRKISWDISAFPPNTTASVKFTLTTTDTYTGSSSVSFEVNGQLLALSTASALSTVTGTYRYATTTTSPPGTSSGSSDSSSGSSSSQPGATATPAPVIPQPTRFESISIRTISATDASLAITTNNATTMTLQFGTNPKNLTKRITDLTSKKSHLLTLPDLTPDTIYYFTIQATDQNGRTITSDLYTFTTAKKSSIPEINIRSLIATSEKMILFSPNLTGSDNQKSVIVVPQYTLFEIQFALKNASLIKKIQITTRDNSVLGFATTAQAAVLANMTTMLEIQPGVFSGRLKTDTPGMYDLTARIEDFNGNIAEQYIGTIKVIQPLQVLEAGTRNPIENARVNVFIYNTQSKMYELLTGQALPIQNPTYTDPNGQASLILPQGKYRVEVESITHEKKTADFVIGPNPGEEYPEIYLTKAPFSLFRMMHYLTGNITDIGSSFTTFFTQLGSSGRFVELNTLTILGCFVILALFALSERIKIPLRHLPHYLSHLLVLHPKTGLTKKLMKGRVVDSESKDGISGVSVFLLDKASGDILLQTVSDAKGRFSFPVLPVFTYTMELAKPLYHPTRFSIHETHTEQEKTFALAHHGIAASGIKNAQLIVESLFSTSFELLLLVSFLLEIFLGLAFGFPKVLPFLILSGINLTFWILHTRHAKAYSV